MCAAGVNQKVIFSKILVAIDSSDASMDAADYATSISQRYITQNYMLYMLYMLMLIYTGRM